MSLVIATTTRDEKFCLPSRWMRTAGISRSLKWFPIPFASVAALELRDYIGMMPEMEDGQVVIDDVSHHETERLLEIYKPDIFCAGIKEKFGVQKMGIPCKQLHSYDSGGPYAGFEGAINFYREIDRMVNMKVWKLTKAPWQQVEQPQVAA